MAFETFGTCDVAGGRTLHKKGHDCQNWKPAEDEMSAWDDASRGKASTQPNADGDYDDQRSAQKRLDDDAQAEIDAIREQSRSEQIKYRSASDGIQNINAFLHGEVNLRRLLAVDQGCTMMDKETEWSFTFVSRNPRGQLRTYVVTVEELTRD